MPKAFNGKTSIFLQKWLRQLDSHIQKNEFGPLSHNLYNNIQSGKKKKGLNVRAKPTKLLRKTEVNLYELGFDSGFLDMTAKTGETKLKIIN